MSGNDFDVIIIGSGAGGGTLARHLAPSGKKILILERGGWLPREIENWDAGEVFVKNRYVSADTWYDDKGKGFQPGIHYYVGGADEVLRRRAVPAAARGLRRAQAPRRRIARLADHVRRARAVLHEGRAAVRGPRGPRRGPDRAAGERAVPVPGRSPTSRGSSSCPTTWRGPAITRSTRRAACACSRTTWSTARASAARPATASRRWSRRKSDAEIFGVRPALKHPNVTLVTNARATKLTTDAAGTTVTGVEVERDGTTETYRADIVVVSAGAANSAKLLLASANDRHPQRAGERRRTRSGATTCTTTARPFWRSRRSRTRPSSRRRWASTTSTSARRTSHFPMGNIQMVGKSSAPMFRGEKPLQTKLAPTFTLDEVATHAVDFWLSTEDLRRPENRVTLAKDGSITLSYTPNNQEPKKRLYDQLKSMLGHLGMHPDHLIPRNDVPQERDPDRGRRASGGDRPLRHRPRRPRRSTRRARPTSWTTCTSSTPASSRASAR